MFGAPFWDIYFDGVFLGSCPGYDEWDAVEFWCYKHAMGLEYENYSALFFAFRWTPIRKPAIIKHRNAKGKRK